MLSPPTSALRVVYSEAANQRVQRPRSQTEPQIPQANEKEVGSRAARYIRWGWNRVYLKGSPSFGAVGALGCGKQRSPGHERWPVNLGAPSTRKREVHTGGSEGQEREGEEMIHKKEVVVRKNKATRRCRVRHHQQKTTGPRALTNACATPPVVFFFLCWGPTAVDPHVQPPVESA